MSSTVQPLMAFTSIEIFLYNLIELSYKIMLEFFEKLTAYLDFHQFTKKINYLSSPKLFKE